MISKWKLSEVCKINGKKCDRLGYPCRRASGVLGSEVDNSLALKVSIQVNVSVLFGLEVGAFAAFAKEVLMINSFVESCVWCGVAFLRGHSGTLPIQMRDYRL